MLWFLISCLPSMETQLNGIVVDSAANPIPQANIVVHNENGETFSESNADEDGVFKVELPTFEVFFVVLSAEGMPAQSFTGVAGEGETTAPTGTLWLRTQQEIDSLMTDFSSCEQTGLSMIDGQVLVGIPGQNTTDLPIVTTASVVAVDDEEIPYQGCYTSDTEEPATQTGDSGQYSIMNLESGIYNLTVTVDYDGQNVEDFEHLLYVPEQGSAPLYPTLIPL